MIWDKVLGSLKDKFSSSDIHSSARAYEDLGKGKKISFSPRSDRYTYDTKGDTNYDKDWTPTTATEKKTLSPDGYYRTGQREGEKQSRFGNVFDKALQNVKDQNGHKRTTAKDKLEAREQADKDFSEQYNERQISIPSTALNSIKYNPKTGGLTVRFNGEDKDYFYPNVPADKIKSLMEAPSKGEYFLKNIHDQYTMNPGHKRSSKSQVKSYKKTARKNK